MNALNGGVVTWYHGWRQVTTPAIIVAGAAYAAVWP
jgi:hypothetical protein